MSWRSFGCRKLRLVDERQFRWPDLEKLRKTNSQHVLIDGQNTMSSSPYLPLPSNQSQMMGEGISGQNRGLLGVNAPILSYPCCSF